MRSLYSAVKRLRAAFDGTSGFGGAAAAPGRDPRLFTCAPPRPLL
jgi:hypothetical protein